MFSFLISYMKYFSIYLISLFGLLAWMVNSWLVIWVLMEMSFVFFVSFGFLDKSYSLAEFMMKYFIIQVFFSLIFMVFLIMHFFNLALYASMVTLLFLSLKLGLFPFHFWLIMTVGKLSWMSFFVLSGPMKVIPIVLYFYVSSFKEFSFIFWGSLMIGSVGGINNCCIQKLMGYSSMVHLCWMIYSLEVSFYVFLVYFLGYLLTIGWLMWILSVLSVYFLNQFKVGGGVAALVILLYGLSLAGFPPLLGFLIKWVVLNFVWLTNFKFLISVMVFLASLSCYFYLQLWFYVVMGYAADCKWSKLDMPGLGGGSFFLITLYTFFFFFW